jgi:hypothetical protein
MKRRFFSKAWFYAIGIAIDQVVNAILCGYPDETLSARSWREKRLWWIWIIDHIFQWDVDENGKLNHCESSYWHEMRRMDLPEEYREGVKRCDCEKV